MQLLKPRYKKIALVLGIATIISAALLWIFEDRFDSDTWKSEPALRYKMVDHLVEQQLLMGKTKQETLTLLGQPNVALALDNDIFLYDLGDPPSFIKSTKKEQLLIAFDNDKVIEVTFREAD